MTFVFLINTKQQFLKNILNVFRLIWMFLCFKAVLNLSAEGDSKLEALKEEGDALCAHEILEDTRRQELVHNFRNIEDEWKRVLDMAQQLKHQAELQDTLSRELKDLQAQEESTQSWVREQLQMLHCLGKELQPQEKLIKVQVRAEEKVCFN